MSALDCEVEEGEVGDEAADKFEEAVAGDCGFAELDADDVVFVDDCQGWSGMIVDHEGATGAVDVIVLVEDCPDGDRGAEDEVEGDSGGENATRGCGGNALDFWVMGLEVGEKGIFTEKEAEALEEVGVVVGVDDVDVDRAVGEVDVAGGDFYPADVLRKECEGED